LQKHTLKNNVPVYFYCDDKFSCNRISIHIALPRSADTAHLYAMLSTLMRRGNDTYNTFAAFNRKLYDLYGAYYDCHIDTVGNLQIITLAGQTIDDSYALSDEPIFMDLCQFVCDMLLDHGFDCDHLSDTDIAIEKQNLIDDIKSIINNKRAFLLSGCEKDIFAGTPMAVSKYGEEADVAAITRSDLKAAFARLKQDSSIYITCVTKYQREDILPLLDDTVGTLPPFAEAVHDVPAVSFPYTEKTMQLGVTQSKTALCWLPKEKLTDKDINAMRVALVLLSKMPTSRLFMNVREKLSLCYYCDARFNRVTGLFTVDMGLSEENLQKAKEAIFAELDDLKAGNISDTEFFHMQKYIKNSYSTIGDSESEMDSWLIGQLLQQKLDTPDQVLCELLAITKQDVAEVLAKFDLCLHSTIIPAKKEVQ